MKKVLFVSHLAHFAKFNIPYMKWFKEEGWEVHYASQNEELIPFSDKNHKISIERSPLRLSNIKGIYELREIIKNEKYDIIHCHTPMGGVLTRLAARPLLKSGLKVIYTAHGFHFYKKAPLLNWLLYYPVEKILSRYTDTLVTITKEDYELATKKKFKAKSIERTHGVGVDLKKFTPVDDKEKKELRKEKGFSESDKILICVAEINKNKNQKFLIETLPFLLEQNPKVKLLLAGWGDQTEYLKDLAKKIGVGDRVYFLGYEKNIEKYYQISDVVVSASFREGLPLSVLEAVACAVPVVCSDNRGHRELIKEKENGFIFSLDNIEDYLIKIKSSIENNLTQERKRKNIEDISLYRLDKVLEEMKIIYTKSMKVEK